MTAPTLWLSGEPEADELLARDPLALLIGMVLDQQIPLEWAFRGPYELRNRLGGSLDAEAIATMDPDDLTAAVADRPALHRFPAAMAKRIHALCRTVVDDYGGAASNVWATAPSGGELLRRVKALPGFGDQKARIFVALLGKRLGVTPSGWQEAAGPYGEPGTFKSVADITDADALARVREHKKAMKREAREAQARETAQG